MLKNLIEKRSALIAEYDALKNKVFEVEKRSVFSNDELVKVNELKQQIEELDLSIKAEKEMEEKRSTKIEVVAQSAPNIITNRNQIENEFRSLIVNGQGKMNVGFEQLESRATVTTSTNSHFKHSQMADNVSIDNGELVLESLGAKKYFFDSGNVDFPAISNIIGTFAGSEGGTVADASLSSAKKTLVPSFVSASIEVTKSFIAQSKPQNILDIMAELRYGIEKAVEKRALDSMSGLTAVASGSTLYGSVLNLEAAMNGAGTGYIFSKSGVAKAKQSKVGTDQGMVWANGMVNGYVAKRSTLISADHAYFGDFRSVGLAFWGDITLEVITDATLARDGKVLVIASALADGSFLDANKVKVIKNVSAHA